MYRLIKQEGRAKRGEFTTVHGVIQTPVFMNVGTVAAIKGAVSTADLEQIGTQVELSNTYHLHIRPGDQIIKQMGGLHKFMSWNRPILLLTTAEGLGWLKEYSSSLPSNVHFGIIPDGLDLKDRRMPYFLLADTFNRVFFTTEGYTIGLGDQLVTAIAKL